MTDTEPTPEAMREFVNRLMPPPQVKETDENGEPLDPWLLAVRRMFAEDGEQ